MWADRNFELYVKSRLESEHGTDGATLWGCYLVTRREIESAVLPFVAAREPDLTDHGVDHIADVIDRCGQILGYVHLNDASHQVAGLRELRSKELLLLLTGCLLHDVGNIVSRKDHNQTGMDVWSACGSSFQQWSRSDRRTIMAVCRAHTGVTPQGSSDTLEPLAIEAMYFQSDCVRTAEIAAVLRFADELAEGPQRTSRYLLSKGLYSVSSRLYHQYASITGINIDFGRSRIALTYDIDLDDEFFGDSEELKTSLTSLLTLVFNRIIKLEHERVFARHYAPRLILFRETSVAIHFYKNNSLCEPKLKSLILTDFNLRNGDLGSIANVNPEFQIDEIVKKLTGGRP